MTHRTVLFSVVLSGMVLGGCDKQDETPITTPPPVRTTGSPESTTGLPDITNKATEMKDAGMQQAAEMKNGAAVASADVTKSAGEKITQVKELVADKKYVDADKALKAVEAMQDQLPPQYKIQITTLRQVINEALGK